MHELFALLNLHINIQKNIYKGNKIIGVVSQKNQEISGESGLKSTYRSHYTEFYKLIKPFSIFSLSAISNSHFAPVEVCQFGINQIFEILPD